MTGVEHATAGIVIVMIFIAWLVFYYIRRATEGHMLYVRRIPGVDAIDEAVGRAAELGRPISFTTGITGVGPVLYACLGVLHYIASKAALFRSRLLLPQSDAQVLAIVEDTVRDAYRNEGRSSAFDPKDVAFLSDEQFAFAAGYMGMVQRERVATAFLFGSFAAESLILAEAGQQVGAMQVAASVSPEQVAFFICTCDYSLIGEEIFAASAYLTREPIQLGSLFGQDRAKFLFFVMIIIGVLIATVQMLLLNVGSSVEIKNLDYFLLYEVW